jgi:diguanylate cyclase (GGDEF)-like protein
MRRHQAFQVLRTYRDVLFMLAFIGAYLWFMWAELPRLAAPPDQISLVLEGVLVIFPTLGMFLVVRLRQTAYSSYLPLMIGLAMMNVSMCTDALDEVLYVPVHYSLWFEGVFMVMGFSALLLGLYRFMAHNAKIRNDLYAMATTDHLTGAANRLRFVEVLHYEVAQNARHRIPLSLVLFDVDHFKRVNDDHGHDEGDRVLVEICRSIGGQIRATDLLARYGGEEFVVLLPNTTLRDALHLAEKFRQNLRSPRPGPDLQVTASFGVAQFEDGETSESLLKRVDLALYDAKQAGRNCVRRRQTS